MKTNQSIESMRDAIATLIDLSADRFSEITNDKNSSITALGMCNKELILEVTYFDPKIKKYLISHVAIKMTRKHKLVPEEDIEIFEPFGE